MPRTRGIQDYFQEDEIVFFEPENLRDLASKIEWACQHPAELAEVTARGRAVYEKHQWSAQRERLIGVVKGLIGKPAGAPPKPAVQTIAPASRKEELSNTLTP